MHQFTKVRKRLNDWSEILTFSISHINETMSVDKKRIFLFFQMEGSNGKEVIAMEMDPVKPKIKRLKSEKSEKMENLLVEASLIKTEFHDGGIDSYEMQYDQTELETDQIDYESKEFDLEQGNLLKGIDNWSGTALWHKDQGQQFQYIYFFST